MPWQRDLLHVACQLTPDATALAYPYVVVNVPRRAGKSAATLAALVQRLATAQRARCWYTAQTRNDAALTFRDEWSPLIQGSALHPKVLKLRQSNGSESVSWLPTRSVLSLFAPGPTALHGQDADAVCVDEAWAFTAEEGGTLEAGIQPAQATRPMRQLWVVSAGGTADSTWLERWVQLGRDGTPGVALVDYSADPDVDDLDDPAVVARVHPAVGHTITLDTLLSIRSTMEGRGLLGEYRRAFLGVWTQRSGASPKLPTERWSQLRDEAAAPGGRSLSYGVETAHDGSWTRIAAASLDADGRTVVEVIAEGEGTDWVPETWRAIRARNRGRLYADALGPTAGVVDLLRRRRLPVEVLTSSEFMAACQQLHDDVVSGQLVHRGQPVLDAAVATVPARPVGDRWVFQRKGVDASALIAVTVAAHGARRPLPATQAVVAAG